MGAAIVWIGLLSVVQEPAATPGAAAGSVRAWLESGPRERCVDVLFVGDGYPAADLAEGRYWKDVEAAAERLFATAPFSWYRASFNVRALSLESRERGCDRGKGDEVATALDTTFDEKNGSLRFRAHDELVRLVEANGATDCVFVLVNCEQRAAASGTILSLPGTPARLMPAPTLAAHDAASFDIALHALGHSLGLLGDEFQDEASFCPPIDTGGLLPGGLNIANSTGSVRPTRDELPWSHFVGLPDGKKHDWLHEGAGRRAKDSFRPWPRCRMRGLDAPFCPVCTEELAKAIQKLCGNQWNDEAYHREHPLKLWKK